MHYWQYFEKETEKHQSILAFYLNICPKSKYRQFQNRVICSSKELKRSYNEHLYK